MMYIIMCCFFCSLIFILIVYFTDYIRNTVHIYIPMMLSKINSCPLTFAYVSDDNHIRMHWSFVMYSIDWIKIHPCVILWDWETRKNHFDAEGSTNAKRYVTRMSLLVHCQLGEPISRIILTVSLSLSSRLISKTTIKQLFPNEHGCHFYFLKFRICGLTFSRFRSTD